MIPGTQNNKKKHSLSDYVIHGIYYSIYGFVKYIPSPIGDFLRYWVTKPFIQSMGKVKIKEGVTFGFPYYIRIGDEVSINANTLIDGCGGIEIGNFVRIAHNATILSSDHIYGDRNIPIYKQGLRLKKVTIKDDCWIGCNTVILPGVTLNVGSVLAANSVLNKDFDPYQVLAGNPSKVISQRD